MNNAVGYATCEECSAIIASRADSPIISTSNSPEDYVMFAPPQLIETEVFAALPQSLRKTHVPAERIAAGGGGIPAGSFLEGPSFDRAGNLYVVDIPYGRVFRITPHGKFEVVAEYDGEPNGLRIHQDGRIFIADHKLGIVMLDPASGKITPVVTRYHREHFKGVNDLTFASNGDLYFTDPPYGLPKQENDTSREMDFSGVFRLSKDGKVTLLTKDMTRPNGIAFSPDEKLMYISNSDPDHAVWMEFPVKADGTFGKGRVFADVTKNAAAKMPGLPDGMKIDKAGNLFATGPGGIYIFAPDGKLLGRIDTGQRTANLAWGEDGSTLFITADMFLCRLKKTTKGEGF